MHPDFSILEPDLHHLTEGDRADVRRAFVFAVRAHEPQKREDGSPYVFHVIEVARTVAAWGADRETIIASLLHDVLEDTDVRKDELIAQFGRSVGVLVEGITKFTQADLSPDLPLDRKVETLRKLFDVMRLDMRSIVIKLADRLHNVQTIDALPTQERRMRFALETLSVYTKIAFHLGMRDVRYIFAEYCVPHAFSDGLATLHERDRLCKEGEKFARSVEHDLHAADLRDRIQSVALQKRNLMLFYESRQEQAEVFLPEDAFSIVIMVRTEEDCYHLLKLLHTLYRPVSGKFRDYIAAPSDAGYQSLHTHVTMPSGNVIQFRIRTQKMLEQATRGITLPLFSEDLQPTPVFSWLRRSASLDLQTRDSSSAFWEALESDVLREANSVTVDRKRLSLPKGATALDAAYALYDARAGYVRGITVNGRPVSMGETLQEDDEVSVAFDAEERVNVDWLQMVSMQHARFLIVDVLKRSKKSEKVSLGAVLLQKELDHFNKGLLQDLSKTQCQSVFQHFRREHFDDVLSMIGEGVMRPRDIVFFLFPDRRRHSFLSSRIGRYTFRLYVGGTKQRHADILAQLNGVIRLSDVTVDRTKINFNPESHSFDLQLIGSCADRLQFADFVDLLDRQDWTSKVQPLISRWQKFLLVASFALAFAVIFLDILLFPSYEQALLRLSVVPQFFIQSIPLIPILIASYYVLRLLRQHVARLRSERWFLGVGFLLNIAGLLLLVFRIVLLGKAIASLLPLIVVFSCSMFYVVYTFFQTDALLAPFDDRTIKPLSQKQWSVLKRRKIVGYSIRLVAVLIWGFQPLLLKYTPASSVDPFVRVYLMSFGATLATALLFLLQKCTLSGRLLALRIPWNRYLTGIVIGQALFMYLISASLLYTTSTNFILLNNFSPVFALLVAALFWRHSIPYLRDSKHMLWIFILFLIGSTGGSLIIYRSTQLTGTQTILGDVLALFAMVIDVLIVTSQIRYIKLVPTVSTTSLIAYMFGVATLVLTAPVLFYLFLTGSHAFLSLSLIPVFWSLGLGAVFVVGMVCNFEAFRRIDGNIAFLMFNLSILINFIAEAFFLKTIVPTWTLIIGGTIIVGATILAESVNSRCQRKGL